MLSYGLEVGKEAQVDEVLGAHFGPFPLIFFGYR